MKQSTRAAIIDLSAKKSNFLIESALPWKIIPHQVVNIVVVGPGDFTTVPS